MILRPDSRAMTVLLAVLNGIAPFSTSVFMPSLPDIARDLQVTPAQVQLSITAYLFGLASGQIFYGTISDRYGRKPVMMVALLIFCGATIVCGLAQSIEVLILGRALQAIGGAGVIVIVRAIIRDVHEGARAARELAIMGAILSLSPIMAPILGGFLQVWFGWRSTFIALLVVGVVFVIAAWFLLVETLRQQATDPLSLSGTFSTFGMLLRDPNYTSNVALGAGAFAGGYAWLSGSAFVLQDLHHLSPVEFAVVFAISSIGFLIGNTLAARLSMRRGLNFTISIGAGALLFASVFLVAAMALGFNSVPMLTFPNIIFLSGMGLVMPQSMASAMMKFRRHAGAASSLAGFIQQGAGGISAAVVGYFMGATEWPVVWGVASMGFFVFALWLLSSGIRRRAAEAAQES